MDYPFEGPDLAGRVVARVSTLTAPKLFFNDQPAPRGPKRGTFVLPKTDGTEATARLLPAFNRVVPNLEVDGVKHELGPKLNTGLLIMSAIPIGLVGIGGALGGLCGGTGWAINQAVLRSSHPTIVKVLIMVGVTLFTGLLWFVLVTLFRAAVR
jgi:hypothetical protein